MSAIAIVLALGAQRIWPNGFTIEEKTVLNMRADGLSIIEIADRRHCSVETINRRIRSIKNKIADIVEG